MIFNQINMHSAKKAPAFTLIELLIVITIIGILAIALLPNILGAQGKARDTARVADIRQFQTALEVYADANGGMYPPTPSNGCLSEMSAFDAYMNNIPKDTQSLASLFCADGYGYQGLLENSDGSRGYVLSAGLEEPKEGSAYYSAFDMNVDDSFSTNAKSNEGSGNLCDPAGDDNCYFVVGGGTSKDD